MPQREACLAGGYIATRLADGKSVRFRRMKQAAILISNPNWR
jgi:hypothetical protein